MSNKELGGKIKFIIGSLAWDDSSRGLEYVNRNVLELIQKEKEGAVRGFAERMQLFVSFYSFNGPDNYITKTAEEYIKQLREGGKA